MLYRQEIYVRRNSSNALYATLTSTVVFPLENRALVFLSLKIHNHPNPAYSRPPLLFAQTRSLPNMTALQHLQGLTACFCGTASPSPLAMYHNMDEKPDPITDPRDPESVATSIISTLLAAEKPGPQLQAGLDSIVGTTG